MSAYEMLQLALLLLLATVFGLATAARRYPHVTWLRGFAKAFPRLPYPQRRQAQKRANIHAGIEMILVGIALPFGYAALTIMTFSSFTTTQNVLVGAGSILCVGLGIMAIRRS